jgi:C1A family cysteine protease
MHRTDYNIPLILHSSTYTPPTCNGGFYTNAFDYVTDAGGVVFDSAYPYNTTVLQCDTTKNDYAVTVTSWNRVEGQQAMIDHVLGGGTLAVAIDSSNMEFYKSGIFSGCDQAVEDHAVQIVGVNVDEGYWIMRNSWGTKWGEKGYLKLALVCTD